MKFDHIEIFVSNREAAAEWYASVFGFHVVDRFRDFSLAKSGPLMISAVAEQELIALFEGEPQTEKPVSGLRRLAFRVSGTEFLAFIESSTRWANPPLRIADVKDHAKAFSIYFTDPDGNRLEVTTYDVDYIGEKLNTEVTP